MRPRTTEEQHRIMVERVLELARDQVVQAVMDAWDAKRGVITAKYRVLPDPMLPVPAAEPKEKE